MLIDGKNFEFYNHNKNDKDDDKRCVISGAKIGTNHSCIRTRVRRCNWCQWFSVTKRTSSDDVCLSEIRHHKTSDCQTVAILGNCQYSVGSCRSWISDIWCGVVDLDRAHHEHSVPPQVYHHALGPPLHQPKLHPSADPQQSFRSQTPECSPYPGH